MLVKGSLSFIDLSAELKNIEYDTTIEGIKKYPCSSELHHIFEKIPSECFDEGLKKLDELSVQLYSKFEEDLNIFVTDGSAFSCIYLEERIFKMKKRLAKERYDYTLLNRIFTNTVRCVREHTNKIEEFISLIPKNSVVLMDPEFDIEENYKFAFKHKINVQVKQKKIVSKRCRKPFRRKFRRKFDKKEYRKRKLGERCFGNFEVRGYRCYYKKKENKLKGAVLIACEHNIIQYFRNKAWCDLFTKIK